MTGDDATLGRHLCSPLPIDPHLPGIIEALSRHRAVVVQAPPGAGKTTRVPPAVLASGLLGAGNLVLLEPRRLAARACASSMARARGERIGETVGYKIRFDTRSSPRTRILVVTEGILTRRLIGDPFLEGTSCVIIDEFHERSVNVDLALGLLVELMAARDDLRLVVMSATLDAAKVSAYLGGCPIVDVPVEAHPVEIEHILRPDDRPLAIRVAAAVGAAMRRVDAGDALVFLPGARQIADVAEILSSRSLPGDPLVSRLHGSMPARDQDLALAPGIRRRVILSTNIAQTSLTIPGVTCVVDSGLERAPRWNPATGLDRLETVPISRAGATQRAGRAGRLRPGFAMRLWTEAEHAGRPEADEPEIRAVDLASVVLQVLACRPGDIAGFRFLDPPRPSSVEAAVALLRDLRAVERNAWCLTALGKRIAGLPVHPRLGVILAHAAQTGDLARAAALAAVVSDLDGIDREGASRDAGRVSCDCDVGRRADEAAARNDRLFERARDQLICALEPSEAASRPSRFPRGDGAILLPGFPDRVCARRAGSANDGVMVGGRGVRLGARSGVGGGDLFLAISADDGGRTERSVARVDVGSRIEEADLERVFPGASRTEVAAVWDEGRARVLGEERRVFRDLVIRRRPCGDVAPADLEALLAREADARFDSVFSPNEQVETLLARIRLAARALPEEGWPDVSEAALRALLPSLCAGMRTLDEVRRANWPGALLAMLGRRAAAILDEQIPERIRVPSGSAIRIDYSPVERGEPPALPVRLQEVFGLEETPRIARGRVALVMHLLSPSMRPVQVTTDLASFWDGTYRQVRKELRARYPKHHWPEDPRSAAPVAGPRRRK